MIQKLKATESFPVLKNSPPKGLWHDNNRPDNQRSYATLSPSDLPGEIQHIHEFTCQVKHKNLKSIYDKCLKTKKPLWKSEFLLRLCFPSMLQPLWKKETFCCRVVAAPPSTRTALRWRRKYLRIVMLASNPSMVPEDTLIGYFNNIDRQWRDSGNIFLKWFLTYFVSHLFLAGTDSECQRRDSGNSERESHLVEPCLSCVWQVGERETFYRFQIL